MSHPALPTLRVISALTIKIPEPIMVPTTIAAERATNPFLRAADAAHFADLRAAKDRF